MLYRSQIYVKLLKCQLFSRCEVDGLTTSTVVNPTKYKTKPSEKNLRGVRKRVKPAQFNYEGPEAPNRGIGVNLGLRRPELRNDPRN